MKTIPTISDGSPTYGILTTVISVTLLALIATLILPGIIASIGKVFYYKDLANKIPVEIEKKLVAYDSATKRLDEQMTNIDALLENPAKLEADQITSLLELRRDIEKRKKESIPPVSIIPFYLNPQMLLWPAIYTSLGWMVTAFRPNRDFSAIRDRTRSWLILTSMIYILYEWPLWMRNLIVYKEGRTVFAYPNLDIHIYSFLGQEGIILGFCALLSALWLQWINAFNDTTEQTRALAADSTYYVACADTLDGLSRAFLMWQFLSVVLASGFLFFTNFFWELVAKYHDQRYLVSAILSHFLWAVSWLMISLPLLVRWRIWVQAKNSVLAEMIDSRPYHTRFRRQSGGMDINSRISLISNLKPLSGLGVSVSGLTAAISFILPLLKMVI